MSRLIGLWEDHANLIVSALLLVTALALYATGVADKRRGASQPIPARPLPASTPPILQRERRIYWPSLGVIVLRPTPAQVSR